MIFVGIKCTKTYLRNILIYSIVFKQWFHQEIGGAFFLNLNMDVLVYIWLTYIIKVSYLLVPFYVNCIFCVITMWLFTSSLSDVLVSIVCARTTSFIRYFSIRLYNKKYFLLNVRFVLSFNRTLLYL